MAHSVPQTKVVHQLLQATHDVARFDGVEDLGGRPFAADLVMGPGLTPRRGGVRRGRGFGQASVRGRPHHGSGPGPTTWRGSTGWRILGGCLFEASLVMGPGLEPRRGGVRRGRAFWAGVCSWHPSSWFRVWNHDVAGFDGVEDFGWGCVRGIPCHGSASGTTTSNVSGHKSTMTRCL